MHYSSNSWGYFHVQDQLAPADLAGRLCGLGFDGYDLFVGPESVPALPGDSEAPVFAEIRQSAEHAGGRIASVVLVGLRCVEAGEVAGDLIRAAWLGSICGASFLHLLPRKPGIDQEQGFRALARGWEQARAEVQKAGLTCTVENHACAPSADEDIFVVRSEDDFKRVLDDTGGEIKVKYDPAWLLMLDDSLDTIAAFERLCPQTAVLDLKDYRDGTFVQPGQGLVDFATLLAQARQAGVQELAVETEHHHSWAPPPKDPAVIDGLHTADLAFFRKIEKASHGR
jgi:sugar phosphate isomerase/epimerase